MSARKRYPFTLAFSPKRMAQPDCHVRRAPVEPEPDVCVRLTTQGQRLAEELRKMTRAQHVWAMRSLFDRARLKERDIITEKKRVIIEMLREAESGDEPVLLQKVCERAGVSIEEFMLLMFHINNFVLRIEDAPDDKMFIGLFFNGDSGEVWAELYEPDRKIGEVLR